jgi:hypothetical protein
MNIVNRAIVVIVAVLRAGSAFSTNSTYAQVTFRDWAAKRNLPDTIGGKPADVSVHGHAMALHLAADIYHRVRPDFFRGQYRLELIGQSFRRFIDEGQKPYNANLPENMNFVVMVKRCLEYIASVIHDDIESAGEVRRIANDAGKWWIVPGVPITEDARHHDPVEDCNKHEEILCPKSYVQDYMEGIEIWYSPKAQTTFPQMQSTAWHGFPPERLTTAQAVALLMEGVEKNEPMDDDISNAKAIAQRMAFNCLVQFVVTMGPERPKGPENPNPIVHRLDMQLARCCIIPMPDQTPKDTSYERHEGMWWKIRRLTHRGNIPECAGMQNRGWHLTPLSQLDQRDELHDPGTLVIEPTTGNQFDGVKALAALYNGIRGELIVNARPNGKYPTVYVDRWHNGEKDNTPVAFPNEFHLEGDRWVEGPSDTTWYQMFLVTTHKGEGYEDGAYSLLTQTKQREWYIISNEGAMQIEPDEAQQKIRGPIENAITVMYRKIESDER